MRAGGRGQKPTHRPTHQEAPTRGWRWCGATGRQDVEAETETEEISDGAGYLKSKFTGAAKAATVGGPVNAGPMSAEDGHGVETETDERAGGAGYPTSQFTSAATAASVGGPVSTGTAPDEDGYGATGNTQREEGGDETPRSAHEKRDQTDGETEEIPPPERSRVPNTRGRRGGKGRGETPTQKRAHCMQ